MFQFTSQSFQKERKNVSSCLTPVLVLSAYGKLWRSSWRKPTVSDGSKTRENENTASVDEDVGLNIESNNGAFSRRVVLYPKQVSNPPHPPPFSYLFFET